MSAQAENFFFPNGSLLDKNKQINSKTWAWNAQEAEKSNDFANIFMVSFTFQWFLQLKQDRAPKWIHQKHEVSGVKNNEFGFLDYVFISCLVSHVLVWV